MPVYLLVETLNKPVDPAILKSTVALIDEEEEIDFLLDNTYNILSNQYRIENDVVERPGTVVKDLWIDR